MAAHFMCLPWKIPWTDEPSELQSMWSQRVATKQNNKTTDKEIIYNHCIVVDKLVSHGGSMH